jgi:type IV pilus assembly protein PilW
MTFPSVLVRVRTAQNRRCGVRTATLQRGLTMVELLVALLIGLLITLAAIAALTATRRGFNTVDTASQLRDNIRFTTDLIQRIGVQTGYRDTLEAAKSIPPSTSGIESNPDPNIMGFNNAVLNSSDPLYTRTARTTSDGSDILIMRFQAVETFPGSLATDGSMIDCSGNRISAVPTGRYDRVISVLYVDDSQGEPSLMCTSTTTGVAPPAGQPIIRGVENFQVLYGVRGVVAGSAPAASAPLAGTLPPDRYLRADQMTVTGNAVATNDNWRRVTSIRIGLVVRGPIGSQQERVAQTFYPFGPAPSSSTGTTGTAMSNTTALDPGTRFLTSADGRMRQTATFTIHLRNDQGL